MTGVLRALRLAGMAALAVALCLIDGSAVADETDAVPSTTEDRRLVVWRVGDRDAADALMDGEGRPRLIYRYWGHRWVRAEFDADGDGRRDVFGVSDSDGDWDWYRAESDEFVTCAIKPQSEDPLSQSFRKAVADLVERRVLLDDGAAVEVREGEGPILNASDEKVRFEIRLRHNPPSADAPPVPQSAFAKASDDFASPIPPPPTREEILAGEADRRRRLSAVILPPVEASMFGAGALSPPFTGEITDALETLPGVPVRVEVVVYPYRVFEPAAVTMVSGHSATHAQVCLDVSVRGYAHDRFCLDADLGADNPVFLSVPATDPSGREWGIWDVELRHQDAR